MDEQSKINTSWKTKGLDETMQRPKPGYIGGADFDAQLDDLLFNRMIRLKGLSQTPQGNDPGKIYWDKENGKAKMWVNDIAKWVDIVITSTSTSTTSTSTTSSSTSTTSTSTTSSSTSTTSTSTT